MRDQLQVNAIQKRIYSLRGIQVMLDEEPAELYGVETRVLNQAVKRNIERFPLEFMFQIDRTEQVNLRSQSLTIKNGRGRHRKHLPYTFTEQGVAMRRFLQSNAQVFQRLDILELKQLQTDQKIERVLNAIEEKTAVPKQGIFYGGQVFDAWRFASDLIRSAKKSIILIDNYIDDTVLTLFSKRIKGVTVTLPTRSSSSLEGCYENPIRICG